MDRAMSVHGLRSVVWLVVVVAMMLCLGSCSDDECAVCPPVNSTPSGWFVQDTPTQETLNNICVINAQTVVAAGAGGVIVRTADGGKTWTLASSGTTEPLLGLSFVDATTGWAVGGSGVALKTMDGGLSWVRQTVPANETLRDVFFVDENTGWISGGPIGDEIGEMVIMKTINGGVSWETQSTEFTYRMMHFVDADSGCVAGGASFRRTTDGGATWLAYDPAPVGWFGCVFFADKLNGWVSGGGGFVAHTADGGKTWETLNSGTTRNITELFFIDNNTGWYVARPTGTLATTSNGGATWTFQTVPTDLAPGDVSFVDTDTGWVSGDGGLILKTVTGGR